MKRPLKHENIQPHIPWQNGGYVQTLRHEVIFRERLSKCSELGPKEGQPWLHLRKFLPRVFKAR